MRSTNEKIYENPFRGKKKFLCGVIVGYIYTIEIGTRNMQIEKNYTKYKDKHSE